MSVIRDQFAGQAMQSLILTTQKAGRNLDPHVLAKRSYEIAEAMIKARDQQQKDAKERVDDRALGARSNR